MAADEYSRRHLLCQGLTLAGVGLATRALLTKAEAQNKSASPRTPDEALDELLTGNERYVAGKNLHHDFGPERASLVNSQRPFAMVLSCADSRVSPEFAFDQGRGRLFVVRLAGNFVDENGLASIEFGAAVLGSPLILVLGHDNCGAIKAAVDVVTKGTKLPGHLPQLISYLTPAVERSKGQAGSLEDNAIRNNVLLNVAKLQNATPILADLVKEKKLAVAGGIYHLATGRVEILGGA
jgi:carbonic anhydrase